MHAGPICQYCRGALVPSTISSGNASGIALALIVLVIGVALCFTLLGALVGIPLIIASLFMGGKRTRVWMCPRCRVAINRV